MKWFLFFSLLIFSKYSFATEPINMACVTEFPTTSFVAMTDGDNVNFRLIHHNGPKFMPIWSNIITPNDLPYIQEAANVLYDLGDELNFSMPTKSCESLDGLLINCFGTQAPVDINGHKVSLWSVHTTESNERSFAGEFQYLKTSLALEIDGKTFWVPMKYAVNECFKGLSKKDLKAKTRLKKLFLK